MGIDFSYITAYISLIPLQGSIHFFLSFYNELVSLYLLPNFGTLPLLLQLLNMTELKVLNT